MNLLFAIIKNDIKLIFRDKSMYIIFVAPIAMLFIFRLGIPILVEYVPETKEFVWLIVAAFTSITAATPSYLVGFIILDERDENVHFLQQILPLPKNFILKSRVILMVLVSFLFSFILLKFNSLIYFNVPVCIFISFLFSLSPPILTLCIVAFSKNKIEAATFYKGLSMVLVIPFAAFFISAEWKFLFGIVPFFWTYNAFQFESVGLKFLVNFLIGILVHTAVISLLYKIYLKRIH